MQDNNVTLYNGDCLEIMSRGGVLDDKSIDMILCDLPYGVLNKSNPLAKWDCVIPFNELWDCYTRVIKNDGAIVLFGNGMFTADLMQSQRKFWRYNLIWDKVAKTGFFNANRMPLRQHEDICIFYKKLPIYHPQMVPSKPHKRNHGKVSNNRQGKNSCYGEYVGTPTVIANENYPTSIIQVQKEQFNKGGFHPTQKPVELLEWLIKTYTNEGDTVLDNCMGSGSTGVACVNTNRKFIGIELDEKYFKIAKERILNETDL